MYVDVDTRPVSDEANPDALRAPEAPAQDKRKLMPFRTRKTTTMNLINEALARARMRELWRDADRRYVGRHRGAREIAVKATRRRTGDR